MTKLPSPTVAPLLTVLLLLQGVQGEQSVAVFSSAGGAATLPCANVIPYPSCSSTTWTYKSNSQSTTVEEVTLGKIRGETHRAKRLSLLHDCSLHITDVTTEDAGLYICQQYPNGGHKYGNDAPVYLSVLTISQNAPERARGSDVTLSCFLHTYEVCQDVVSGRDVRLSWVDEGGTELQDTTTHRTSRQSPCSIRLTVKLREPNPRLTQRTWRCQLTAGGQPKTSVSHIIKVPVKPTRTPVVTREPTPPPPSTPSTTTRTPPLTQDSSIISTGSPGPTSNLVLPASLGCALVAAVAVCVILTALHVRRKRAGGEASADTQRTDAVLYSTVNKSATLARSADDMAANITYAEVSHFPQAQALPSNAADSVTYATISISTNKALNKK